MTRPSTILKIIVLAFLTRSSLPLAVAYIMPAMTKPRTARTPMLAVKMMRTTSRIPQMPPPLSSHETLRIDVSQSSAKTGWGATNEMRPSVRVRQSRQEKSFFMMDIL